MIELFWLFFVLIIYCYAGYPMAIRLLAKCCERKVSKAPIVPSVSIVISVHNEEDVIARKIDHLLSLDYPKENLEVLIGSDGSTDKTNEIVSQYAAHNPHIRFIIHANRRGKMATIADLVKLSLADIIIFNDARQTLDVHAIRTIVSNFADPSVGCVSGELVFLDQQGHTSKGINLYWEYEKFIRNQESKVHSMLGATGAFYAIRRTLFVRGPDNVVLDDMYIPLKIVQQGYRAIFDGEAHAYDRAADNPQEEHRRKARTLYGNYQIFGLLPGLFNPFTSPIAIQFFSHKLLRVLVPILMIALLGINMVLLGESVVYRLFFALQIIFYVSAMIGSLARDKKYGMFKPIAKVCYVPYVFCLLNYAALTGLYRFITGKQESTWQKARRTHQS